MTAIRIGAIAATIVLAFAAATSLRAQDAAPKTAPETQAPAAPAQGPAPAPSGRRAGASAASASADGGRVLPADSTTEQTVELPAGTLKFKATAGSIPLRGGEGKLNAEIAYIAYERDDMDAATRPVAFVVNGGPGSSSIWTNLLGFGPWRLAVDGVAPSPSAPPLLIPNAETWLDFADLVFIDPAGTGFSQIAKSGPGSQELYSVTGDVDEVAETIATWLRNHGRLASPKLLVGESYSGIRAPKVLSKLQSDYGAGVNALLLISPVMDFALFRGPRHRLSVSVNTLPTIAEAAREAKGHPFTSRAELADVEAYARGDYLADLMRGPRDAAAVDRIVQRVAAYSGLPEAVVRQYGGRLDEQSYIKEANRGTGRTASGYDATVTGADRDPTAYNSRSHDPFADALVAPLTEAMVGLYAKFGWKIDLTYHALSYSIAGGWRWGNKADGVESITDLESALSLDPRLEVLVTHGATDLRTPYLASVLLLDQLPAYAETPPGRVRLKLYAGGHMHYTRDATRKAMHEDVKALLERATARAPVTPN